MSFYRISVASAAMVLLPIVSYAQVQNSAEIERISAQAVKAGKIRVNVGLNVPTVPEASLDSASVDRQRNVIKSSQRRLKTELEGTDAAVQAEFTTIPYMTFVLDSNALAKLKNSKEVRTIDEDLAVEPNLLESTAVINAPVAWTAGVTGTGSVVAVLDTGMQANHPFLQGKIAGEGCYSSNTSTPEVTTSLCPGGVTESTNGGSGTFCEASKGTCNHGTHVAGIVAGKNGPGNMSGVAKDAKVYSFQVFSYYPNRPAGQQLLAFYSDINKALERTYQLKRDGFYNFSAVNMSLGGGGYTAPCDSVLGATKTLIDNLKTLGVATVISAGNLGYRDKIGAPACISSAISVAATCDVGDSGTCSAGLDGVASYSNIASFVTLAAPGSYINSSVPTSTYAVYNGTSMAAPHVAGAIALIKQNKPTASVDQIIAELKANGKNISDTRSAGTVTNIKRIDFAYFKQEKLIVQKVGAGAGTVSTVDKKIDCGSVCEAAYSKGARVEVLAKPDPGSVFKEWRNGCTGSGACVVDMSMGRIVTAQFVKGTAVQRTVTITKNGNGVGTVSTNYSGYSCGAQCTFDVPNQTPVTFTATASPGSKFVRWGGACGPNTGAATGNTCQLNVNNNKNVIAVFN